jgi:hypothetical protein
VAGQAVAAGAWNVTTRAPAVSSLALDRPFNGSHYFLVLMGSDFGPRAGLVGCPGEVSVTANDEPGPCDELVMTRVCFAMHVCFSELYRLTHSL